jgi:hypothetical protein
VNDRRTIDAIESTDTDELIRIIDGLCAGKDWAGIVTLRGRCQEALERGKQLWGVEEHIRYRLALEAPGEIAAPVVAEGPARFTPGPLAEVLASTKSWAEVSGFLPAGPIRATVAAERVVRGDLVEGESLELPARLLDWEPAYPTATYKADGIEAPTPELPHMGESGADDTGQVIDDPASEGALADLVLPWTDESNGRLQVVTVEGGHLAAIHALGLPAARTGSLEAANALAWMAWAGASGGAHGRRRGAAAGRYLAWWVVANLADLDWPADPSAVGAAATSLAWHWFDDGSPDTGWVLRLAVTDPDAGLSWAVSATDSD